MVYMLKVFLYWSRPISLFQSQVSFQWFKFLKFFFSDSEEENQNSDTTNSDEDSDGLEIRLDFQPLNWFLIRLYSISQSDIEFVASICHLTNWKSKISEFKQLTRIYTLNMKRKKAKWTFSVLNRRPKGTLTGLKNSYF